MFHELGMVKHSGTHLMQMVVGFASLHPPYVSHVS